ncbi:uncharacterized protein TNCV_327691 [Trichonephila clavipes]|nr:uncharacterized protein TNCV_327691 [Trichonephila clavipes]
MDIKQYNFINFSRLTLQGVASKNSYLIHFHAGIQKTRNFWNVLPVGFSTKTRSLTAAPVKETEWILGIENDIEAGITPSEPWEQETTAPVSVSIPKSNKRIKTKEEDTSVSMVRITPSEQWEQETTASSSVPIPNRRVTTKEEDTSASMVNKALDILKTAAKLDKEVPESNEIDSFFTYVAAKVRKYSPEAQKTVQHAVFDILMKADNGLFD